MQITNATSSCIGVMANFEKGSKEYNLLLNRVKMGCAAQSRQIDKTKIGEAVKGIPTVWKQFQKIKDDDTDEVKQNKRFYNSILVDKKPYFFRYKYNTLNKEYNEYIKKVKEDCEIRFCETFEDLQKKDNNLLTNEEKQFIYYYERYLPVVNSDCVMNRICKYIESIDFQIKQKVKTSMDFDYKILVTENFAPNKLLYREICEEIFDTLNKWEIEKKANAKPVARIGTENDKKKTFDKDNEYNLLKERLEQICSNEESLANHLVYLFYVDKPSYNKNILWQIAGKQIYQNVLNKTKSYYFPQKNENGNLKFLQENYSIERVVV